MIDNLLQPFRPNIHHRLVVAEPDGLFDDEMARATLLGRGYRLIDEVKGEEWGASWSADGREAQAVIEQWRQEYNHRRPHGSLGYLPPAVFADQARLTLDVV